MLNIEDVLLHEEKLSNILEVSLFIFVTDSYYDTEPTKRY